MGWSDVVLTVSTPVGRGSAEPRSLHGECMLRCAHMEKAMSGAMVVASVGSTKFIRILTVKNARRSGGGDDIRNMYMRYLLRACDQGREHR
jgi:hypothetical protein